MEKGHNQSNYEKIAEQIAEAIEQQQAPWQKPWKPGIPYIPFNPTTGKQYQGINTLILMNTPYADPRWMTFIQAQKAGYSIKKGAKAHNIIYWKTSDIEEVVIDEQGNTEKTEVMLEKPRAYWSQVFNASDIEGIPPLQPAQVFQWEPIDKAEELLSQSGAVIRHDSNSAFYNPTLDEIHLPAKENFESSIGYYQTALHELGHWTGHPDRLNRPIMNKFGTTAYAKEELVAEITSVMTGGYTGLGYEPKQQNISYIKSWAKKIRNDPTIILQAAAEADKATKFIIGQLQQEHTKAIETHTHNIQEQQEESKNKRIYIIVPYAEKNEAKSLGAVYDREKYSWYIPENVDPTLFSKWKINENIKMDAMKEMEKSAEMDATATINNRELPVKQERVYIAVPYDLKEEAKKMGAKWDYKHKSWYVSPDNIEAINKWNPNNKAVAAQPTISPQEEFQKHMEDLGAIFTSLPIMDGKPHRIEVQGDKKGQVSGFYVGYLDDGIPAGYFKNNRTGEESKFSSKGYHISKEDRAVLLAQAAQKQENRMKEQEELHNKTSIYLTDKIAAMQKAEPNKYTEQKKINITNGVYKTEQDSLCIPIMDNKGQIWSAQYINDDGTKRIAKNSRKTGCFHPVGGSLDELKKAPAIVIAEGYATAVTISEAVGFSAVAAINASNLAEVAKSLKDVFPEKPFIIAGDNDFHLLDNPKINKNVGVEYAQQAAKEVNGIAIFPEKENDFNDVVSKSSNDKISQLKNIKLLVDNAVNKCRHEMKILNQDKNKKIERTNSIQKNF